MALYQRIACRSKNGIILDDQTQIGVARATVGFYESGERLPDALVLRKIAEACNVSADWVLGIDADVKGEMIEVLTSINRVYREKLTSINDISRL